MSEDEFLDEGEDYIVDIYADIERNLRSYSGFDSLLRELIQNSDDSADGQNVNVDIFFNEDSLILKNNTVFTDRDWEHIKKIGSRNKENDSNRAGRFGIGFTSVFKICDCLYIHSKGMSKKADLSNLGTSKKWWKIKPKYNEDNITEFEFFWRTNDTDVRKLIHGDIVTPQKRGEYIKKVINSTDNDLYFLKNIARIRIYEGEKLLKNIEIKTKSLDIGHVDLWKEIKIINVNNKISDIYLYHLELQNEFTTEYASGVARNSSILLSIAINCSNFEKGRIFCTLPTEMHTDSLINVNSDFQPDPNRKQIITKTDDEKGKYNFKIFGHLPSLLYSIIDDLKSSLPIESFYTILNSFLNNETILDPYFQNFIDILIRSDLDVIFINNEWRCISDVKFSRNSIIIPFLERIGYPIIPYEHSSYYSLFEKFGVNEFELEDLISLIEENVPEKTLFEESIFESKDELISIFKYLENLDKDTFDNNKDKIKRINVFLTNKSNLVNVGKYQITRYPKELELVKEDLLFTKIDNELFHIFRELLERLDIFTVTTPKDIINKVLCPDFEDQVFPLDLMNSKPYLNTKEKFLVILNFLDPFLRILKQLKKGQQISKNLVDKFGKNSLKEEEEFIRPHTDQYKHYELYLEKTKYLPLSLSEEGSLYPLDNDKVFNLNSHLEREFASRYRLVSVDPDIASILDSYGFVKELDLCSIFFYVKQECESGIKLEKEFLLLLYRLMVDKENQLIGNSELKLLIENLPIFIDNKGNNCSLKNEQKEVLLQGSFDDYTGIARILDNEMIDSVAEFKKSILIDHFKIKTLDFRLFVETYFEEIFNESDIDTDIKLELIKDLSKSNIKSEKVGKVLENTKFIYCNDYEFHYPSERGIFYLATKEKESFALKNGLPIMDPNVKAIVSRYNLTKSLEIYNILSYTEADFNKGESLKDSDAVLLYKLIYDDRKSLSNKELKSRIRRLPIFKNTQGNLCTLENNGKEMVLLGDYRDPIGIDEILSNDLIDKVNNFKETVLKEYLGVKTLDFKLFIERNFPEIFNDESIEKSKKLELLKELNKKFLDLNSDPNFDINILKRIKLVYCQDGNFYFPDHPNLYFKNELIDEIFEGEYLFPCLEDFEDYRRMYEILGIKSQLSPQEIIDYVKKKISLEEINLNLINKMRTIFVYINDHWKSFEDFSELAEIKWLPATDDSKTLYNPSSLFTQSKGQNTRPYLIYLDNIKYLDVKDKHLTNDSNNVRSIKSKLIDVIGLNNVSKIPTSMIIENLRLASESAINIQNPLQIYLELNNRSSEIEIDKLNDFSSIYRKYENDKKPFYFKPKDIFRDNEQALFGKEYIGFLSSEFFIKCNKLVVRLGILNKPDIYSTKRILEKINKKYENNNFIISLDVDRYDRTIVINCLERLSKNVNKIDSNFKSELYNLHIFLNDNDQLLTPLEAILEDNPNIADQFPKEFHSYFVKYNIKYLDLEEKLGIRRLSELIEKRLETEPILDSLKINSELTKRMRSIAKLMNRIKNENKDLDEDGDDKWVKINPYIEVYTFENLNVTKYVNWLGQKYCSSNKCIDCYFVKNGSELDIAYVRSSKTKDLNSVAQELFEEIHPRMNKNFIAVLHNLLHFESYDEMNNYLTVIGYAEIQEDQNTLLNEEVIETENAEEFGKNEDVEDDTIVDMNSADINYGSDSLNPSMTSISSGFSEEVGSNFSNKSEALAINNLKYIDCLKRENKVYSNTDNYKLDNNYNEKNGNENECLKSNVNNHENSQSTRLDTNLKAIKKFRTLSPSMDTNYSEKINEQYSGVFNAIGHNNEYSGIEEIETPLSREETQKRQNNTKERINQRKIEASHHNKNRGKSERPDPNIKDETAINEVKEWYKCRCQICGRTFRKKSGSGDYCEVAHLIEIKDQGISDISNMVCLCSYHAAVLKKGFFEIVPESIKKNKVTIRVYDEYDAIENKYKTNEYVIKYRQNHFLDFQALLELNNEQK